MNWRNPFLITYLSVTAVGAAIFGYLLYSGYTHYTEVEAGYFDAVTKLQQLQNRVPFPSVENNRKYVEYTKEYRAEYDKLLAKVAGMQKPLENITPEAFVDLLRANVSQIEAAAKQNNVQLAADFYLGFDQYRGTLPSDEAAAPLARELAAIRLIVDQLILLKVHQIDGIKRDLLAQEAGRATAQPPPGPGGNNNKRPGFASSSAPKVVSADSFEIVYVADQSAMRASLDFIANSDQFFIIRYLNVLNSALDGPKKVADDTGAGAPPPPAADPAQPPAGGATLAGNMRLLAGRERLTVALRIEMITFNNLPAQK